jgi:hypothetical protein
MSMGEERKRGVFQVNLKKEIAIAIKMDCLAKSVVKI